MSGFSPETFAKWLTDSFKESTFKSYAEIADAIKVSRTTVSSYATARPQTNSNKPSRPKREIVIRLAEVLNKDVNEALLLAGHAPTSAPGFKKPTNVREFFELLDDLGLDVQFHGGSENLEQLGEEDLQELLDGVVANASAKAKRLYNKMNK